MTGNYQNVDDYIKKTLDAAPSKPDEVKPTYTPREVEILEKALGTAAVAALGVTQFAVTPGGLGTEFGHIFGSKHRVIPHPVNREALAHTISSNTRLSAGIEIVATNIVGLGWDLRPSWDDDPARASAEDKDKFHERQAEFRELVEASPGTGGVEGVIPPTFTDMCRMAEVDWESFGEGYIEQVADDSGRVAEFNHVSARGVYRRADLKGWVQVVRSGAGWQVVHYRNYGSREVMHRFTGEIVGEVVDGRVVPARSISEMDAESRKAILFPNLRATELVQFKRHNIHSRHYGIPEWLPAQTAAMGTYSAGVRNLNFFKNDAVPRAIILVDGGELTERSAESIERFLKANHQGAENSNRIMVLEGAPTGPQGAGQPPVKISFMPITVGKNEDATHARYREKNDGEVAEVMQLSKVFFSAETMNRATAFVARQITDEQRFAPARRAREEQFNRLLRAEPFRLDPKKERFRFRTLDVSDDEVEARTYATMSSQGAMTVNEIRARFELPSLNEDWADKPIVLVLKEMELKAKGVAATAVARVSKKEPNRQEAPDVRLQKGEQSA